MSLLKSLLEKEELDALSSTQFDQLKSLVTKGAKESDDWSNALELVHKAYEVAQVQRPTPDMKAAWKQYDELISLAVSSLSKAYGLSGDWRMSSHIFREGANMKPKQHKFEMSTTINDLPVVGYASADHIDHLIRPIFDFNLTGHDIEIKHKSPNNCSVYFCKDGKRTGHKITIKKVDV